MTRAFGASLVTQLITLRPGARRLDFETEADWHEREKFLKAAFPVRAGAAVSVPALVAVDNPAVVTEAVKLADDQSGDVVVRLYESRGGRASTRLTADFTVGTATATDLLERPLSGAGPLPVTGGSTVELSFRPFQIRTLRLTR